MEVATRQELQKLLNETSHALNLQDIAQIVELDGYARAVRNNGVSGDSVSFYAWPVLCGGTAFHAPTIGKEIYWQEQIAEHIPEKWQGPAYLWLLASESVPDQRGKEIVKAVRKWARHATLTGEEVEEVHAKYAGADSAPLDAVALLECAAREFVQNADTWAEAPDSELRHMVEAWARSKQGGSIERDYGAVIALLVREFHQTPSYWLNAPEEEIRLMLDDWTQRQEAKAATYRASKAGRKNPLPPTPSPKIKALKQFRLCKERIRATWLKTA